MRMKPGPSRLPRRSAPGPVRGPDRPVEPHRHHGVLVHLQVGLAERVAVLADQEAVAARAEIVDAQVIVPAERDTVVGEARRDVHAAAADAGAPAVHGALSAGAVGDAADEDAVLVGGTVGPIARDVAIHAAADGDELIACVPEKRYTPFLSNSTVLVFESALMLPGQW
jgi:hypothetical protein